MTGNPENPIVLAAVDDVFFSSRIESVARLAGVELVQALDEEQLGRFLSGATPQMIILDLNGKACAPIEAIRRIKADARLSQVPLIGALVRQFPSDADQNPP